MKIKIVILILGICGVCAGRLSAQGATATILGAISDATSAGRITASNAGSTPRQIQFGLKLNF